MSELDTPVERHTSPEVETVRCIIENGSGQVLLLQKTATSKAPNLFEFPGGKIDDIAGNTSTDDEQLGAVTREIMEEATVDISDSNPQKVEEFSYEFSVGSNTVRRKVHMYHIKLPTDDTPIAIDQTRNASGESEDKHMLAVWVSKDDLQRLKTEGKLSGNSQKFEKALSIEV